MVGTGGHAKQWVQWLLELGQINSGQLVWLEQTGYTGPPTLWECPVWVEDASLSERLAKAGIQTAYFGIGCVTSAPWRWGAFARLQTAGVPFTSWQHPSALVSASVVMGAGAYIGPLAVVQPFARLGEAALINTGAIVEHDVSLGQNVHIAPHATVCGDVRVGDHGFVGAGAVIKQGVTVPAGSTVGAGVFFRG
jgi:sugar O-acyltransferase (sialic acid O-acetyltransferase NeuD family)